MREVHKATHFTTLDLVCPSLLLPCANQHTLMHPHHPHPYAPTFVRLSTLLLARCMEMAKVRGILRITEQVGAYSSLPQNLEGIIALVFS